MNKSTEVMILEQLITLKTHMDSRFDAVDLRFDAIDLRFDGVESRLDRVESRLNRVESRLDRVEASSERLDYSFGVVSDFVKGHERRISVLEAEA